MSWRSPAAICRDAAALPLQDIAAGVGIKFDVDGTTVLDHFSYASNLGKDHSLVATDQVFQSPALLSKQLPGPVLFRGSALLVPRHSELVLKALVASETAYSAKAESPLDAKRQLVAGASVTLAALMQARNNARVAVLGSLEMLGNELMAAAVTVAHSGQQFQKSGNAGFAKARPIPSLLARTCSRPASKALPPFYRRLCRGQPSGGGCSGSSRSSTQSWGQPRSTPAATASTTMSASK